MWSLPDISAMNASKAEVAASDNNYIQQAEDFANHDCDHCGEKATVGKVHYDIFSEDPSGVDFACKEHESWIDEEMFCCKSCDRRMLDHITWERYQINGVCLTCAAKEHFDNEKNWIDPSLVEKVELTLFDRADNHFWDEAGRRITLCRAPHVLGVKQPLPEGIEFVENFEFDSMDGHQISGGDMLEAIKALDRPFTVVMDAAYQFAVSIGIYQRKLTDGEKVMESVGRAALAGHFNQ